MQSPQRGFPRILNGIVSSQNFFLGFWSETSANKSTWHSPQPRLVFYSEIIRKYKMYQKQVKKVSVGIADRCMPSAKILLFKYILTCVQTVATLRGGVANEWSNVFFFVCDLSLISIKKNGTMAEILRSDEFRRNRMLLWHFTCFMANQNLDPLWGKYQKQ